jgi:hypothetical protein
LSEERSQGFPFTLKLFGLAYLATALLLLVFGWDWWAALLAAIFISPVLATPWRIAAKFLFGPLTTICRKPALLWYLHKLRKSLAPAVEPSRDWSPAAPSVLGGGLGRALLTTVHRGTFVQLSLLPTPKDSRERHFLPSFMPKAKCRLMIGVDTTSYWDVSEGGRLDLTCEEARDWYLGDTAFDEAVQLMGPPPHALAVLTPERRRALLSILADRWQEVSLQCKPPSIQLSPAGKPHETQPIRLPPLPMLHQTIEALVSFVEGLAIVETTLVPALLANAASEPIGFIRRRILEALASMNPEGAQLDQAVALASRDEDPLVRIWAAKKVGGEWGLAEMRAIAKNPRVGIALRMEAVRHLLRTCPPERVWPDLEPAYLLCSPNDRATVLHAMLAAAEPALIGCFAVFLRRWDPTLALDAIFQLGSCGQPFVEDALLDLLGDEKLPIRLAALQALGASGTRRVLPLLFDLTTEMGTLEGSPNPPATLRSRQSRLTPHAIQMGTLIDQQLRDGAEAAIRRIQAREQIGDAGQVSLAEPDPQAGAVSLMERVGELELVGKQKGEG